MNAWMEQFCQCVLEAFPGRVEAIGLQGRRGRGEGTAQSDIDVVLILDQLSYEDLQHYDRAIAALPQRELICGFVSGREELAH